VQITTSTEAGTIPVTVMHVQGSVDSTTYEDFTTRANELIENGVRNILMDFSQTPFISSAGLRALHGILRKLQTLQSGPKPIEADINKRVGIGGYKSPHLKLLNLSRENQIAFELSGFNMFIEIYTDREKAIASFEALT
jgi:anti-anti-sigma factor